MLETRAPSQLELLGGARALVPEREPWRLERKAAGLLAYLALEGATPRSKLAGLLWPDSPESTARNNLRQTLRRVRDGSGAGLVAGEDPLWLAADVAVDAARLELACFAGRFDEVIALEGELLGGHDYDECAEFTDWLLAQREHLTGLRREAFNQLSEEAERAGDHRSALAHAERLLEMDPISEVVHRRVMRLHYLLGDRGTALRAFERCRTVLERELGVEPLPETRVLASQIEAGERVAIRTATARREIPLSVQRPPRLVGRAREWAALEAAWKAGLGMAVSGEPGVGKTRLVLEFLSTKGTFEIIDGRPGDDGVPYATISRSFRNTLARHPDLELAPWARRELARLIPSLDPHAPAPISSDTDKLRFLEAMASLIERLIEGGAVTLVFEDLQFADAASLEAGQYFATRFASDAGPRLHHLSTFRSGELRPEFEAMIQQGVDAGRVALLEVRRLEPDALGDLLSVLDVPGLSELGPALARHTGGNPLFVLETLRSLIESGDLERGLPKRLPVPDRIGSLVARRLERLTPPAQRLARTVAVAGADFDLELGAGVLETQVLDLSEAWSELEAAQVVHGAGFAHDLLAEAALSSLPAPIRTLLHRRIAEHLEHRQVEPVRIARHWLESGEDARAAPHLLAGARLAQNAFQYREATTLLERVARILEAQGDTSGAFDALYNAGDLLQEFDPDERMMAVERGLFALMSGPLQESKALMVRAARLLAVGQTAEAEPILRTSLERAIEADDETMQGEALYGLGAFLWYAGRPQEALGFMQRSLDIRERLGVLENVLISQHSIAVVLGTLGRRAEARAILRQVRATELRSPTKREDSANTLIQLAVIDGEQGLVRQAISTLLEAHAELEAVDGSQHFLALCLASLASCRSALGEYALALETYARVFEIPPKVHPEIHAQAHIRLGLTFLDLGESERAQAELAIAETLLEGQSRFRESLALAHARLRAHRGEPTDELFVDAERRLETDGSGLERCLFLIGRAATRAPDEALNDAQRALELAQSEELEGLALGAHARMAHAHLELGQASSALEHSLETTRDLDHLACTAVSRAELLFTHFRALEANHRPEARTHLEQTLAWLLETADQRVPPEFRTSFLTRNPANRTILEAAARLDLGRH